MKLCLAPPRHRYAKQNATKRLERGASLLMALMIESGFPGCRAVAIAWLSRSTAARRAAESSAIVRETSVAVSMARSAMPGWNVGWGVSMLTCHALVMRR